MTDTLILIGFMGAGKTTVGNVLADISNRPMIDLDEQFVYEMGISPKKFMEQKGEIDFRRAETEVLKSNLNYSGIISTGGGVVESNINRQLIKNSGSQVVFLKTNLANTLDRLSNDSIRPLLQSMSVIDLQNCWNRRAKFYQELANVTIETTNKSPIKIANEIVEFEKSHNELLPLRSKIDSLDRQIFDLISQRFDVVHRVADIKERNNISVVQSGRMNCMRSELKKDFQKNINLSDELIEEVMSVLFNNSIQKESMQIKKAD